MRKLFLIAVLFLSVGCRSSEVVSPDEGVSVNWGWSWLWRGYVLHIENDTDLPITDIRVDATYYQKHYFQPHTMGFAQYAVYPGWKTTSLHIPSLSPQEEVAVDLVNREIVASRPPYKLFYSAKPKMLDIDEQDIINKLNGSEGDIARDKNEK